MEKSIVGREKEMKELKKYLSSEQSEFIAVYGRRCVGNRRYSHLMTMVLNQSERTPPYWF